MYQARLARLTILLLVPFALLLVRLFWLQVVERSRYAEIMRLRLAPKERIPSRRGTIMDRHGRPLAWDEGAYDLVVAVGQYEDGTALGNVASVLGELKAGQATGLADVLADPDGALSALLEHPMRAIRDGTVRARENRCLGRLAHLMRCRRKPLQKAVASLADGDRATIADVVGGVNARPLDEESKRAIVARMKDEAGALLRLGSLLRLEDPPLPTLLQRLSLEAEHAIRRREVALLEAEPRARHRELSAAMSDLPRRRQVIARRVDPSVVFEVFLHPDRFPGFRLEETVNRRLADGAPLSVLKGLGSACEGWLAGTDGSIRVERGPFGQERDILEWNPPRPGRDLELTIDLELQTAARRALAGRRGAAVLMDCSSGELLAIATSPDYTPEEFRTRYEDLVRDRNEPLIHKAVLGGRGGVPYPGSTFKVVVAIAGLEERVVDAATTFDCVGYLHEPKSFRCLGVHGAQDLHQALVHSCNVYFYNLGERLGGERLAAWGARFGFGQKSGIEMRESAGRLFSPAPLTGLDFADPKSAGILLRRSFSRADSRFFGIGQVVVEATPLQVCRMIAAIGNGGRLVTPHTVRRVSGGGEPPFVPVTPAPVDLHVSPATLAIVSGALRGVVEEPGGTASGRGLETLGVAGKSGTADHSDGRELLPAHAWFAGYAPASRPEVAVVIFLDSAGEHGGIAAAPLGVPILERYFAAKSGRNPGRAASSDASLEAPPSDRGAETLDQPERER